MKQTPSDYTQCVVIGGCAHGTLIDRMHVDAERVELRRPEYVKPFTHSTQTTADVAHESDVYDIHTIMLAGDRKNNYDTFALAVIEGQSLSWAFSQLVIGYLANETSKLLNEKSVETH